MRQSKASQAQRKPSSEVEPVKLPERDMFETLEAYEDRLDLFYEETGHTRKKLKTGPGNAWEPTPRERLEAAIAFASGCTQALVARYLGVSESVVCRTLKEEYEFASHMRNMALQSKLFRKAMEGDTACLIFLAKNWLGMSDRVDTTSGGQPLPPPRAEELSLRVIYVVGGDPRANPGPPQHLLEPPTVEATASAD